MHKEKEVLKILRIHMYPIESRVVSPLSWQMRPLTEPYMMFTRRTAPPNPDAKATEFSLTLSSLASVSRIQLLLPSAASLRLLAKVGSRL